MSPEPLYGGETRKAIENFPISGEPVPAEIPVPDAAGTLRRTDAVFTVATSGHLFESTWTP